MRTFLRRFLMHYGIYRRYPWGCCPPCATHGALPAPDANQGANYRPGAPTRTALGASAPTIPQRVHIMRGASTWAPACRQAMAAALMTAWWSLVEPGGAV